ncbi:MAG: hypothetical protein ABI581_12290 [Sediminibacterium sp.]
MTNILYHLRFTVITLACCTLLLAGCGKSGNTPVTTGTGTTTPPPAEYTTWQLTGIKTDNSVAGLTPMQTKYQMTLYNDGIYTDTDGATGHWSSPADFCLDIHQANLPTPLTIHYRIKVWTKSNLVLTFDSGSSLIQYSYEAR